MVRTARAVVPNYCYHLINRGNNQARLFHDRADYVAFLWLIAESLDHVELPIIAACVMPNHLHLVVCPRESDDLARWAHWIFTTHARRYHKKYGSSGRVWQGRFKASIVEQDQYFLVLMRYVERNALKAGLAARAEEWEWGSLRWRMRKSGPVPLSPPPLDLPRNWIEYVNSPQTPGEFDSIRSSISRQAPIGSDVWIECMAADLGLGTAITPLGRPRSPIVTRK